MLENRDDIVAFYGSRWQRIRVPWLKILHAVMAKDNEGILETAIKLAKMGAEEGHSLESRFILALAVEEIEKESGVAK